MPNPTTRLGLTKPTIDDTTVWGDQLNTDLDIVDAGVEILADKDQPDGYPSLDGTGKIPISEIPVSAVVGGSDLDVQFNDGGSAFGGDSLFTWNKATKQLKVGPNAPVPLVISGSIVNKSIFSYGASGIQRLTLGDLAGHYFGDNLEILHVFQDYNNTQAATNFPNAVEGHARFNGATADSVGAVRSAFFVFENIDSHKLNIGIGLEGDATTSLGDMSQLIGFSSFSGTTLDSQASRSVVVDEAIGVDVSLSAFTDILTGGTQTSTITLATGVHVLGDVSSQSTITEWRGVHIDTPTTNIDDAGPGGTIVTKTALKIGDYSGGNSIFSSGGLAELFDTAWPLSVTCDNQGSSTANQLGAGVECDTTGGVTVASSRVLSLNATVNGAGTTVSSVRVLNIGGGVGVGATVAFWTGIGINSAPSNTTHATGVLIGDYTNGGDTLSRALSIAGGITEIHGMVQFFSPVSTATPVADFTIAGSGLGSIAGFPTVLDIVQEDDSSNAVSIRNQVAIGGSLTGALLYTQNNGAFVISLSSATITPCQLAFEINGHVSITGGSPTVSGTSFEIAPGTTGVFDLKQFDAASASPKLRWNGKTSGSASIKVLDVAGTPNDLVLPTATAAVPGSVLTSDGANPQQLSWVAQTDLTPSWNDITNATGNLTLANAGFTTTFNQTSAVAWTWANTTAATNVVSQSSPIMQLAGQYWNGSASAADVWTLQDVVANGTNGSSILTFLQTGSNGNAQVQVPALLTNAVNPTLTFVQTASDTMARGNENPMSNGGNWVVGGGGGINAGQLVSNKYETTAVGTAGEAVWTGNGAGFNSADQYSEVKLAASTSASTQVGPMVRCSTSATTHYRLSVSGILGGSPNWTLYLVIAGAVTILAGPTTFTFAVNDLVRLAVIGNSLYCYKNGVLFYTTTDSSIATGVPGMIVFESSGAITDAQISSWTGGTVTAPSGPYTGNVTLQNAQSALAGLSYSSPILQFAGQFWNGSASALDQWNVQNVITTGVNGASDLTITRTSTNSGRASVVLPAQSFLRWSNSATGPSNPGNANAGLAQTAGINNGSLALYTNNGSSALFALFNAGTAIWNFTSISGAINWTAANTFAWSNTTAATSGTSQSSPILSLNGKYWDGAASQTDSWTIKSSIANGTNGTSTLQIAHTGSTGVSAIEVPAGSTPPTWGIKFAGLSQGISAVASNIYFDCGNNNGGIHIYSGSTELSVINHQNSPTNTAPALTAQVAGSAAGILGRISTQIAVASFAGNVSGVNFAGTTAGTQTAFTVGIGTTTTNGCVRFIPASGATNFVGLAVNPEINQTGTSSGNYTGILVNVVETALKGTDNRLLDLQSGATGGTSRFTITNGGIVKTYNSEATAGVGQAYNRGSTSQKAETGADTNVLTVTPAAVAGTYRVSIAISVSAANTATLGWTATWTDSNGTAQAPTNISLFKNGTAAPALTFTAAANDTYTATILVDVNNAGTNIVVKTTFTGTSIAYKISAIIERIA